jgi:hypothetical protein
MSVFTNTFDQETNSRPVAYPNVEDVNFLGFNRDQDVWKVDASGTINIVSASGTSVLPVYLDSPIPVEVAVDIETDSIKVFSASGTPDISTYIQNEVSVHASELDIRILDKDRDSISMSSCSGTCDIPVYFKDKIYINDQLDVIRVECQQDLSIDQLNYTSSNNQRSILKHVLVNFSPIGVSEHVVVKLNSKSGSQFNTILASGCLESGSSFFYLPENDVICESGDEIDLTCTNLNTPASTVYGTIVFKKA